MWKNVARSVAIGAVTVLVGSSLAATSAQAGDAAADSFNRTVASGWGTANQGGSWVTAGGGSQFSVDGSRGVLPTRKAMESLAHVPGSAGDVSVSTTMTFQTIPSSGSGLYVGPMMRYTPGAGLVLPRLVVSPDRSAVMNVRYSPVRGQWTILGSNYKVPFKIDPGTQVEMRAEIVGTAPATIRAKVWRVGSAEPSGWNVTTTSSAVPTSGASGYYGFVSSSGSDTQVLVDNSSSVPVLPPNSAPTAAFSAVADGLQVSVDAAQSADSDGTITGYSWDFGDGATGAGRTASHSYAESSSYDVTLTVTDNRGDTATKKHSVTVTRPNTPLWQRWRPTAENLTPCKQMQHGQRTPTARFSRTPGTSETDRMRRAGQPSISTRTLAPTTSP